MVFNTTCNQLISVGIDNKVRFTDADSCEFASDKVVSLDSEPFSMAITSSGDLIIACEKEVGFEFLLCMIADQTISSNNHIKHIVVIFCEKFVNYHQMDAWKFADKIFESSFGDYSLCLEVCLGFECMTCLDVFRHSSPKLQMRSFLHLLS